MKGKFLFLFLLVFMFIISGCGTKESAIADKKSQQNNTASSAFETVPDGFRVVTVGSGNPKTEVGRGAPSTLVQYNNKFFLVDSGENTTSTLLKIGLPAEKITNMLFTHQHVDHNGGFWNFFIDGWQGPTGRRSLNLVGPQVQELYDTTVNFFKSDLEYRSSLGWPKDGIFTNVNIKDFTENQYKFELDGVKITSIPVPHTVPTYAYRFDAKGQSVVVSGDLIYSDKFAKFAKNTDILVIDGMLASDFSFVPEQARENLKNGLKQSHATIEDLAKMAAESKAKKLVLTHIGLGKVDIPSISKVFSDAGYKGKIIAAEDGLVINP
ncbi:ribonuclease BN (tRNA processing enzyme) [Neobacillus niacini]|uniref:MBL fold metallo-hydrolase n=1 Tax=Neobacillus niacini TaxID=86668 RepID=UPI00285E8C73|nr:MBL fold metallo-hydrolase [Neobacillus niacini]MDR7077433.1 ribonuclease BN (tRNA processing enzyme) [Neobacillus niacini]